MSAHVDMKVVLLGKEFCGKTSLVERFLNDRFAGENRYQNTIGAAYGAKRVTVGHRSIMLGIWDTAGSERYESMSRIYYRGAKAAILCYDVTNPESWERLRFWASEIQKFEGDECVLYLCATKIDLLEGDNKRRKVDYHTTTDFAEEIGGARVFETSSRTGQNVEELFRQIAADYLENPKHSLTEFKEYSAFPNAVDGHRKSRRNCCRS